MTEITRDNFLQAAAGAMETVLIISDLHKRFESFSDIMEKARELGLESVAQELARNTLNSFGMSENELWELPEMFGKTAELAPFPINCLPEVLRDYLKAVSDFVQVRPEMGALVMLSTLALCVQGKAVVKHPISNYTAPLNLYTLTIAEPGQRKSGVFSEFMKPIKEYERHWNEIHSGEIAEYYTTLKYWNNQKEAALKGKNANLAEAKHCDEEIAKLKPVHPLKFNINDATPEALAEELLKQNERIAIMDDEGTAFDVFGGIYSNGPANISIVLKAYDGEAYSISRRTKEDITLYSPLLTFGIMTQPQHFREAVENNSQFTGRGFLHRFLFSLPESKERQLFSSPDIPQATYRKYSDCIEKLLNMKYSPTPAVIRFDGEGTRIAEEYHNHVQGGMSENGIFSNMKEWANKQTARFFKIAALLHLCEHEPTETISGQTSLNAVNIAVWCENQALLAVGELSESPIEANAKYILGRIKKSKSRSFTRSELLRMCRRLQANEITEPLELLEDMHYVRVEAIQTGEKGGRQKENIVVNPLVFE